MINDEDITTWPLANYGIIVRGDETTSEDEVAVAVNSVMAERIALAVNLCRGIDLSDLLNGRVMVVHEDIIEHVINILDSVHCYIDDGDLDNQVFNHRCSSLIDKLRGLNRG
ncbi:TPA: hypothetical protein PMD70_002712 [Vibrio cholerae]|nr:hypothetical protein [Vibrio cholerae]